MSAVPCMGGQGLCDDPAEVVVVKGRNVFAVRGLADGFPPQAGTPYCSEHAMHTFDDYLRALPGATS